jgi:hypothetical protein
LVSEDQCWRVTLQPLASFALSVISPPATVITISNSPPPPIKSQPMGESGGLVGLGMTCRVYPLLRRAQPFTPNNFPFLKGHSDFQEKPEL